ncbi:Glycerophosphoryl diester phosphodiesterase family-domain-containing protein [Choanephora cucurbitarum]|nr:Glycerophosphoryl diester phosphodiesterase family-domain-containing protein [Choanephora cucurbitarum]
MKFGKTLLSNQIPEWSRNYLSYKSLKGEIKSVANHLPASEDDITAIVFHLDRELEKVNTFYVYKQSMIHRRLWILQEKLNDENDEVALALKETRSQMDKLMWFAELNSKGFRKILKKLDKKIGLDMQHIYWETKVAVLPFATSAQLRKELDQVAEWISTLTSSAELEQSLKSNNNNSSLKLARYTSKNEDIFKAVQQDNQQELQALLKEDTRISDTIVELAVEHESLACLDYLVSTLGLSLLNNKDINERNLLHRACLRASSTKMADRLLTLAPSLSLQKDFAGRRPLHYAAEKNHPELVRLLMKYAMDHQAYSVQDGFAANAWQDREGFTPLFFGIIHGSTKAVEAMIEVGHIQNIDESIASTHQLSTTSMDGSFSSEESKDEENAEHVPDYARSLHHPSSVALACKLSNPELLTLLINKGASVDLADEDGDTPLLFAIRSHFIEGIQVLIDQGHVNVDLSERVNGWTPLMVAAMEGFKDVVEILLKANANKETVDFNGWTATDHAVFRGYLDIGRLTLPKDPKAYLDPSVRAKLTGTSDDESGSSTPNSSVSKQSKSVRKSVSKASRLYGHKYLTDLCMIVIRLGSNDVRNPLCHQFIELSKEFLGEDQEKRLSLSVSATNASGEFPIIDLPSEFKHDFYPEPIVLFTPNPNEVTLRFDLIETFGSSRESNVLARGTSVLAGDFIFSKLKGFKGPIEKASLRGQQKVPLVQAKNLDCIGSLGFEFLVITPFKHKNLRVGDRYTYYKSVDTQVIGHRGSGMNKKGAKLQVGENTVLSFVTAASLGAEYVEFDVQLTKDLVPVIYHDWTVTETGYDIPLNSITLEQFLNLRRSGHIKEYHTGVSDGKHGIVVPRSSSITSLEKPMPLTPPLTDQQINRANGSNGTQTPNSVRPSRSLSFSSSSPSRFGGFTDPFEQTRTSKAGKMKGNGPETIQGPFTTLAETLRSVPKSAGFNIEVKYPMVDEAEQDEMTSFQELNVYVDTILECVYDNVEQDRHVIFSSFHPEICLALNLKQPNYPVFFLTDAGTLPMADIRCNSLQEAVRFAKQADLLGIVAASEPILEAPRMVQVIKEMGLLLFTYGVLNNEVENAIAQKCYGVDAVIVDSVLPVRKGLRGD